MLDIGTVIKNITMFYVVAVALTATTVVAATLQWFATIFGVHADGERLQNNTQISRKRLSKLVPKRKLYNFFQIFRHEGTRETTRHS